MPVFSRTDDLLQSWILWAPMKGLWWHLHVGSSMLHHGYKRFSSVLYSNNGEDEMGRRVQKTADPSIRLIRYGNVSVFSIHRSLNSFSLSFLSLVKNCNHKGLGIYYLLSAFIFGISGTLISVLIRIELYSSGNRIISPFIGRTPVNSSIFSRFLYYQWNPKGSQQSSSG